MSPERNDDAPDGRHGPPADRENDQRRAKTTKSGKTKASARPEGTPDERAEPGAEQQAGGASTTDRPRRASVKRASTRGSSSPTAASKSAPAPLPVDPQDELPPHGDALETREMEKPARGGGGKPRGRGAAKGPAPESLLPNA